jgi:nucleotide-binding universal stress UspA family protein
MQAVQANKRISLSNILATTDFSTVSETALRFAIALAGQYEAKIFVAHVLSPEPHLSVPMDPLPVEDDPAWLEGESKLAAFVLCNSLGVRPAKVLLERGDLWSTISEIIQRDKIDLVVAGTHGRQGVRKVVLGSSAEKIYRQANCPVLTVGPNVRPLKNEIWNLKQILFPTDGSESSLAALPYALSLAEENQATLIFLRLEPLIPPEFYEVHEAAARKEMRAFLPPGADAWCRPEFEVRFEYPAKGILRFAKERDVSLIVMGVKKSAEMAISDHLPWPIASQVVADAQCPVLTVRG